MHLIQKIKSYFLKYDLHSWKDFDSSKYEVKFRDLSNDTIIDIVKYLRDSLSGSDEIGSRRHRLKNDKAICCNSIDELIVLIKNIVAIDYDETSIESELYKWSFQYVVGEHKSCKNTICISNVLTSKGGNCIYALVSIRKVSQKYYLWNHLQ